MTKSKSVPMITVSTAIAHSPPPRPATAIQPTANQRFIAHMNQDRRSMTIYMDATLAEMLAAQAKAEDRPLSYVAVRELKKALTNMAPPAPLQQQLDAIAAAVHEDLAAKAPEIAAVKKARGSVGKSRKGRK